MTQSKPHPEKERILLVDDNPTNLQVLFQTLSSLGHDLLVARDGVSAIRVAQESQPSLILLDIMMPPGIDGFETCRQLKENPATRDIAVIFLSALDDTDDKVRGLTTGAVDYVSKPFKADEVIARVRTHLTIVQLQRKLDHQNAQLLHANNRMQQDLIAAEQIQRALLPAETLAFGPVQIQWMYQPCDRLAGDALNIFQIDEHNVGVYVLDVVGHGVSASLLSVAVMHALSPTSSIGSMNLLDPVEVAATLNTRFPMLSGSNQFFTLFYGVINTQQRSITYTLAAHPPPMHVDAAGQAQVWEGSGLPIGVVKEPMYNAWTKTLSPGTRLFIFSDGLPELRAPDGTLFGDDNLKALIQNCAGIHLTGTLDRISEHIIAWNHQGKSDDISVIAIEINQ
ncbi:MAG: SpoIIE family protein phosphatase [Phycisphaeraceae bacterium]|nr:SpoIIE family protein phosphatase [Phycisphaerales bacterium]MCB9861610.1 SpoIIE family protein phosphatase [Phycisphaeraceae bacterium]